MNRLSFNATKTQSCLLMHNDEHSPMMSNQGFMAESDSFALWDPCNDFMLIVPFLELELKRHPMEAKSSLYVGFVHNVNAINKLGRSLTKSHNNLRILCFSEKVRCEFQYKSISNHFWRRS